MPFKYWDESFRIVVFLHNRPPSPVSQVSLLYSFFLIMFLITRLLEYLVVLAILTLDHITSINLSFGLYNVHFQVIASLIKVTSVQTPSIEFSYLKMLFFMKIYFHFQNLFPLNLNILPLLNLSSLVNHHQFFLLYNLPLPFLQPHHLLSLLSFLMSTQPLTWKIVKTLMLPLYHHLSQILL